VEKIPPLIMGIVLFAIKLMEGPQASFNIWMVGGIDMI